MKYLILYITLFDFNVYIEITVFNFNVYIEIYEKKWMKKTKNRGLNFIKCQKKRKN